MGNNTGPQHQYLIVVPLSTRKNQLHGVCNPTPTHLGPQVGEAAFQVYPNQRINHRFRGQLTVKLRCLLDTPTRRKETSPRRLLRSSIVLNTDGC